MLVEMAAILPKGYPVYVTFDSWYASAKLIKLCRRQGWHVICALKSNRLLNGKSVKKHDQALKHRRYTRIRVRAADQPRAVRYFTRSLRGCIANIRDEVCVIISRRHPGSAYPKYFLSTDLSLSSQEALNIYRMRWPVEVDNLYLKSALGLGDFRLQSFEAIQKWFQVVLLALNYLQYQQALTVVKTGKLRTLADFIRIHRQEHASNLLHSVAKRVLACGQIEPVLQSFILIDPGVT
jgi:transposase